MTSQGIISCTSSKSYRVGLDLRFNNLSFKNALNIFICFYFVFWSIHTYDLASLSGVFFFFYIFVAGRLVPRRNDESNNTQRYLGTIFTHV